MQNIQIATLSELEEKNLLDVQVDGLELILVKNNDAISVFEGYCPHQGTLLAEGHVENNHLVCGGHGWRFNVSNGSKVALPKQDLLFLMLLIRK